MCARPQRSSAIGNFSRVPNGGLIVTGSSLALVHRDLILKLAARHRLRPPITNLFSRLPAACCRTVQIWLPNTERLVHRSYPQRREANRSPGANTDEI